MGSEMCIRDRMKYSAFDRELLAVFLSIRHFRHMLEGRPFAVWTDHKPLCGALSSSAEKSPRQTRHLYYISEFSSDIRHVSGEANVVADALSVLRGWFVLPCQDAGWGTLRPLRPFISPPSPMSWTRSSLLPPRSCPRTR